MPAQRDPAARVPPRFVVGAVMRVHQALTRLAERLLPADVALQYRMGGLMFTQMLHAVVVLGVAERLAERPLAIDDLARATGADADALHRTMRALVSVGIFERDDEGRYRNNRLTEVLRPGVPRSIAHYARYVGSASHVRAWADFAHSVRTGRNAFEHVHGQTVWDYFAAHPDEERNFAATMTELTLREAPVIAAGYPFFERAQWCDVAGGRGTLLAAILAQHPTTRGMLFDALAVVAEGERYLRECGVIDRVDVRGGSFFDAVPAGCDGYILKDILHDWDDARALEILANCRRAMKPGGRLLVIEMLVERESRAVPGTIVDVEMMTVTCEGRQRGVNEFRALFDRAGLRLERVLVLPSPTSVVEATAVG